jgi:hypothetical protein
VNHRLYWLGHDDPCVFQSRPSSACFHLFIVPHAGGSAQTGSRTIPAPRRAFRLSM